MKRGICPKCGSTEVFAGADVSFKSGTYNSNAIPVNFWHSAALDNYVCFNCGYVESYIADYRQLERIAKSWPLVVERKAKR